MLSGSKSISLNSWPMGIIMAMGLKKKGGGTCTSMHDIQKWILNGLFKFSINDFFL